MIFITGDIHAAPYERFNKCSFPEQDSLTKDDVVIICGDFGIWHDCGEERAWLNWLNQKNFTTCFCDGNHENFDRLYGDEFEIVDFCGGKAQKIRENVYHLLRGEIYDIQEKRFFIMGGASSHDIQDGILDLANFASDNAFKRVYKQMTKQGKMFRVNHFSWWRQELPGEAEMDAAVEKLKGVDYTVDYIVSHCAPTSIIYELGYKDNDAATDFLQTIKRICKFKHWFFGHYHRDEDVGDKFTVVYHKIIKLEG